MTGRFAAALFVFLMALEPSLSTDDNETGLLVVVFPGEGPASDGFKRFESSAEWAGAEVLSLPASGQQVASLRAALRKLTNQRRPVLVVTSRPDDVIVTSAAAEIVRTLAARKDGRVVLAADSRSRLDPTLGEQHPSQQLEGYQFVNPAGVLGSVADLLSILDDKQLSAADGQLAATLEQLFQDEKRRKQLAMVLDQRAELMLTLTDANSNLVAVQYRGREPFLQHLGFNTVPGLVLATPESRLRLHALGNYLAGAWEPSSGCVACWRDAPPLKEIKERKSCAAEPDADCDQKQWESWPRLFAAVFVERATPFFEEFLRGLREQVYPKQLLDLWVWSGADHHVKDVTGFAKKYADVYHSLKVVDRKRAPTMEDAYTFAIKAGLQTPAARFLFLDSTVRFDSEHAVKLLIEQNRDVVAPMLDRRYTPEANFQTNLLPKTAFMRSLGIPGLQVPEGPQDPPPVPVLEGPRIQTAPTVAGPDPAATDYMNIVTQRHRGLWNVPFVSDCYVVKREVVEALMAGIDYSAATAAPTAPAGDRTVHQSFCRALREAGRFIYVSNRVVFGHLVSADGFVTSSRLHAELWQVEQNRWDWERRYLHPNYTRIHDRTAALDQPCPDVFWVPLVTERFCQEMIDTMEDFGQWSNGKHQDTRISGGYESVPTRDIHMKQIGYDREWHAVLRDYVRPVQQRVFIGYDNFPPHADLNFVVRYKPDEQPALRPHHDASTYTINVALNAPGLDYQGGGCRFLRYNCSVTASRRGWLLMHPGQLTHMHEGLPTTAGTRYILVSFVDPAFPRPPTPM